MNILFFTTIINIEGMYIVTKIIHVKDRNKYDLHDYVYIGRKSKWGNPFKMKNNSNEERNRVIKEYFYYIMAKPDLVEAAKLELKDKVLGCFCFPKRCHGDILAAIAEYPNNWKH